jgi:hypothetical protein
MTYNFDAERWLENQRALVAARRARGELDEEALARAIEELDRRYDEMVARLDGSFQLPRR